MSKLKKQIEEEDECETCDELRKIKRAFPKPVKDKPKQSTEDEFWEMKPPPDLIKLGRCTWTTLHTMAAYYPENPSTQTRDDTRDFLRLFSRVYPCKICAKDFGRILNERPPRLDSRKEFSQWMCEAHNDVNKQLGKPEFDCSKVDERWRGTHAAENEK